MSVAIELTSGERGDAVRLEGEVLQVVVPKAFAPGAPMTLRVLLEDGVVDLSAKTIGSKRRDEGLFDVRARLVNLRRSDRERLLARLG